MMHLFLKHDVLLAIILYVQSEKKKTHKKNQPTNQKTQQNKDRSIK